MTQPVIGLAYLIKVPSSILVNLMDRLEILCLFAAARDFSQNLLKRNTLINHHNSQMIEQIGNFVDGLNVVSVLRRDDRFGALLAHLLEDLVDSLVKKIAGV